MDPIVAWLRFGELARPLGSYGLVLSAAMAIGASLVVRAAARARLDAGAAIALTGLVVAGGLAGAAGLHAGVEWARTGDPTAGLDPPGLVFYGAPAGGLLVAVLGARPLGLPLLRLLDLSVPALAAAHALGRIGCFLGGCCFGAPWQGPLAVRYTHPLAPAAHPPVPRHPVPLYESAALLVVAGAFALWPARRVGDGMRFAAYLLTYAALRFGLELLRGDAVRGLWLGGRLSTSQLLAALVGWVAMGLLAWLGRRRLVSPAAAR